MISLACQQANIPLYILSDTLKIRPKDEPDEELEHGDPKELLDDSCKSLLEFAELNLLNPTFEVTPFNNMIRIITENGVLSIDQLSEFAERLSKLKQYIVS